MDNIRQIHCMVVVHLTCLGELSFWTNDTPPTCCQLNTVSEHQRPYAELCRCNWESLQSQSNNLLPTMKVGNVKNAIKRHGTICSQFLHRHWSQYREISEGISVHEGRNVTGLQHLWALIPKWVICTTYLGHRVQINIILVKNIMYKEPIQTSSHLIVMITCSRG